MEPRGNEVARRLGVRVFMNPSVVPRGVGIRISSFKGPQGSYNTDYRTVDNHEHNIVFP